MSAAFDPGGALIGGVLVGAGLAAALFASGRVVGVSGVVGGLLPPRPGDRAWRLAFVLGLLIGGVALAAIVPEALVFGIERSLPAMGADGFLVGLGTRLGNGCTSGHGVCGVSRLSVRSLVATLVFIATGALTVFIIDRFYGGRL